jgi:hypothetical protein
MNKHLPVLVALALLAPASSFAVPAWSRMNDTNCSACHATPTMQLNAAGLKFAANGHRNEPFKVDKKDQTLENYVSFIWKYRVFADTFDSARTGNATVQRPAWNLEQHSFAIYTGGALSDRFSYFTELYLSENTGSTSGANIVQGEAARKKLAEAFLQYNHPLDPKGENFLAVRAGEILPGILHVFGVGARSGEQRSAVLNDALAGNSNTYRPFSRQQGADVTLVTPHGEVAFGLVNGSDTSTTNSIDADTHKDWFASALYKFDKNESALGVFHYNGQFTNYTTKQDFTTAFLFNNEFHRTGLLGRYIQDKWRLVGTYFWGEETLSAAKLKGKNKGGYALLDYNFTDSLGTYLRYDFLDPNTAYGRNETRQVMLGFNTMFFQSTKSAARLNLEYTQRQTYLGGSISAAGTTKYTDKRYYAQISWGF